MTQRRQYNSCTEYEWDDGKGRVLTFRIDGYVSPYVPAQTYGLPEDCYPAEGGELEDWTFDLINGSMYDEDGNLCKEFADFDETDRRKAVEDFDTFFAADADLFESIQDRLAKEVSYDDYDDYD